ncbi:monodechloroaminopyrrolnitrin synthase PrnB family protein [uncultured Paraglaciecola sp.]|uniref:PrnB family protein n=1 Tax=uncultured Paraglaciecola sp. TaxID=1765024 RepID=UPI0030DA31B7|tara:strand:- start:374948 stop:376126 length:1179 start_codon:yes stop_codon:yes gene_type:complete
MKLLTPKTLAFDSWIRSDFVQLNDDLEALYFQQEDKSNVAGLGDDIKEALQRQGRELIIELLAEGNTDQGFDSAFDLLGNVGLYMAACRRHEITEPSRETHSPLVEASALAMHIGASIGVTPRFATAHLTTHNSAQNGIYKRFTSLEDEKLFVDYNTRGILAYKRAADALLKIQPLGISHPICFDLLVACQKALQEVIDSNAILFERLDATRFFYCVRPYYKPYRVGSQIFRGANAGDFAGINVIDMQLGLCMANDPNYSQLLVDKFLYMMPEDQSLLRDCMRRESIMNDFLNAKNFADHHWYQSNLEQFLLACALHGETANQHHEQLVNKYITEPSSDLSQTHLNSVTASGPPLASLLSGLEKLKDKRMANQRSDILTRFDDLNRLKASLK